MLQERRLGLKPQEKRNAPIRILNLECQLQPLSKRQLQRLSNRLLQHLSLLQHMKTFIIKTHRQENNKYLIHSDIVHKAII
jgi:hypothetical protein